MSKHRDVTNAQAALNEEVGKIVAAIRRAGHFSSGMAVLLDAWDAFEEARNEFDGPGAASARRTSINAAHANVPLKGSMRRTICEVVASQYQEFGVGMTCDALEARLRRTHQSVSPAVNAVEQAGWIQDSGKEQLTRSGQPAIVWEPTDKLIERLREIALGAT